MLLLKILQRNGNWLDEKRLWPLQLWHRFAVHCGIHKYDINAVCYFGRSMVNFVDWMSELELGIYKFY